MPSIVEAAELTQDELRMLGTNVVHAVEHDGRDVDWDFLDSFSPTTTVGVCRDSTDELGSGKHCS